MEGKRSKPRTFNGKMECKFCGEKDKSKLIERISALRGKIIGEITVCVRCMGKHS